ncbi:hypothetical protein AVEN_143711-1 [Araneus ventricosus]|uniref:Uncharacterized protein n=1 Tax=Araneus ventricosus TaxID=182803 RepID=A0A4Y2ANS2_ARAVE|nr:hypothetical protein AVEN_143711-1 [Araneus ventricosus]
MQVRRYFPPQMPQGKTATHISSLGIYFGASQDLYAQDHPQGQLKRQSQERAPFNSGLLAQVRSFNPFLYLAVHEKPETNRTAAAFHGELLRCLQGTVERK